MYRRCGSSSRPVRDEARARRVQACRVFDEESRSALAHKATGFSAKLLKRGDQCRAVLACSHLYWQPQDAALPESVRACGAP